MVQTKKELEEWFETPDPWDYETTPDDEVRRQLIIFISTVFLAGHWGKTLDIGCAEGFITQYLPGQHVFGLDISEEALKRVPARVKPILKPEGKYSLIVATGVLYDHYDYKQVRKWIDKHASHIVLTSHYDKISVAHDIFDKPQLFYAEYPYRDGKQILRVYKWA